MKNLTTLVNNFQPVTTEKQLVPESASVMDRNEIDAIKYFFVKMEQTYRKKYSYIVGNPEEQKRLMAQFGSLLKSLTKGSIDTFFAEKQMSLVKNNSEWPDIYDLVGEVTGLRRNSEEAVKSWTYFLNRRMGEDWLDAKTFETVKRIGCGCNELVANLSNNNTEKAKNTYIEKYNALLTEIDNGFKLPELALVIEHKTGSNQGRTEADKERIKKSAGCQDFFKQFKRGVE